jgi:phage shock protein A
VRDSLLARLGRLVRADEDAAVAGAAHPEQAVAELLAELADSISEVEEAVVRAVGEQRRSEGERAQAQRAVRDWEGKAAAAAGRAASLRVSDPAGASRFDELARVALRHLLEHENALTRAEEQLATQTELAERLREGLAALRAKRETLLRRKAELDSRGRLADAQLQVQRTVEDAGAVHGAGHLDRVEDDVEHREALASAFEELDRAAPAPGASPEPATPVTSPEVDEAEVERRLRSLRHGG